MALQVLPNPCWFSEDSKSVDFREVAISNYLILSVKSFKPFSKLSARVSDGTLRSTTGSISKVQQAILCTFRRKESEMPGMQ